MEKILIVDDETHVRQLLKKYLEGNGYLCDSAGDAGEAREKLAVASYDLLISDIYMPGESGVDLAKYVKATFLDTAIIIASSMDDPDRIKDVLDIGVYGYIVKPIERNYVFINVENALQRLKLEQNERKHRHALEKIIAQRTAKLAESEGRFRGLVEGSIQGTIIHNRLKPIFANQAFLDIHGYTEEELTQVNSILDFIAPEEHERMLGYKDARLRGEQAPSQYEYRGIRKDGSRIWLETRVRAVDWEGDKMIQLVVSDITKRKQSEESLRNSEASLKTILASVLTGVLVIDEETQLIVDANHYAVKSIGAPKNQIVGKSCYQFICPAEKGSCPVLDLAQEVDQAEKVLLTIAGDSVPIIKTVSRTTINGRKCLIESFIDISDRIKEEVRQKEQLHFLAELLNSIPYPFYFKDRDGVYQLWNSAYEQFKGIPAEEVIGKTAYEIYPRDVAEGIQKHDNTLYDDPTIQNYTIQLQDQGGNIRDMEVTKSVYTKRDGSIGGLIGLMMDMTDKNRMEAQLHHAQKLESIGQLAAGIAHEINTPTQYVGDNTRFLEDAFKDLQTVLKSYSKLLEAVKPNTQYQPLVEELEETLEDADLEYLEEEIPVAIEQSLEGVDRVSKIVRSMKEFSHPGVDEKTPVNLNKAIESTITVARNEWKYVADIKTDFDQSVPPVSCFPGELNQVFLNIIVNAAHAIENGSSDNGGGKGKIHISTLSNDDTVEIRISDTGGGIPPSIKHRIFDPFFTTKEVGKGTGQGLSIAHTVITENHNGTITCESEEGSGTTFTIQLPLTDPPSAKEA